MHSHHTRLVATILFALPDETLTYRPVPPVWLERLNHHYQRPFTKFIVAFKYDDKLKAFYQIKSVAA